MAIFHLNAKTGTRAGGQSAGAKAAYNLRDEKYARHPDAVAYDESGNMPEWAAPNPLSYWKAADAWERANGRLFKEVEFALPRELSLPQQRSLAHDFAVYLAGEQLPYTLAIHEGRGENPHAHLLISERMNDGIEREPRTWFRRFNAKDPAKGGAQKTEVLKPRQWLEDTRVAWAYFANRALKQAGYDACCIDHRSFDEQGIERAPTVHRGPTVDAMARRGVLVDRLQGDGFDAVPSSDPADRYEQICEVIAGLTALLYEPHPLHEERQEAVAPVVDGYRKKEKAEMQRLEADWKAEKASEALAAFDELPWLTRRLRADEGDDLRAELEKALQEKTTAERAFEQARRELEDAQKLQDERFRELDNTHENKKYKVFIDGVRSDLEVLRQELQALEATRRHDGEEEHLSTLKNAVEGALTPDPPLTPALQEKAQEKASEREDEPAPSMYPSPWN